MREVNLQASSGEDEGVKLTIFLFLFNEILEGKVLVLRGK